MKFKNVDIYGITRIIFNGNTEWNREPGDDRKGNPGNWKNAKTGELQEHEGMMGIINVLKRSLKYQMSTNMDTLYVKRVEKPQKPDKIKHEITAKEIRDVKNLISKLQSMSRNRDMTCAYAEQAHDILQEVSGRV